MLILFDIDMTLLSTGGSGMKSMSDAARDLYPATFHGLEGIRFAGRLDPLIIGELLAASGQPDTPANQAAIRRVYTTHLRRRLQEPGIARALPGVMDLLAQVQRLPVIMGLLTGNYEETGSMKLRAAGIDPARFSVRVWGDESPHWPPQREHLVPVGIGRAAATRGRPLRGEEVVVIGDTPHDIACASAHACRSLGVATGHFSVSDLEQAGATMAVPDLTDTRRIVDWLSLGLPSAAPAHL